MNMNEKIREIAAVVRLINSLELALEAAYSAGQVDAIDARIAQVESEIAQVEAKIEALKAGE